MYCAQWNWETNLKSLNDFHKEALSVMWGEAITLQNSSYPRQSIKIHHLVATHSSQNGKKRAEEGKVCVIPLIKSWGKAAQKLHSQAKSFVLGKLVRAGAIIPTWTLWLWVRNSSFSEMGGSKSLWIHSITTQWFKLNYLFALCATTGLQCRRRLEQMIATVKRKSSWFTAPTHRRTEWRNKKLSGLTATAQFHYKA